MRCLVTAGPSFENLDRVRRITNFSTGRLGTGLALALAAAGHQVTLLRGRLATAPPPSGDVEVREFTTSVDLAARFLEYSDEGRVAVLHAAAVADFGFGTVEVRDHTGGRRTVAAGKLSTREDDLWVKLRPTPKLLAGLREWYPRGWLVGWKYEAEGPPATVVDRGRLQLGECRTDLCVLNGPGFGPGFGLLAPGNGDPVMVPDAAALGERLIASLADWSRGVS